MLSYLCGSSRKILPIINLPETEFQYENEKVIRLFFTFYVLHVFSPFFRCHLDEYLSNPLHYSPQGNKDCCGISLVQYAHPVIVNCAQLRAWRADWLCLWTADAR